MNSKTSKRVIRILLLFAMIISCSAAAMAASAEIDRVPKKITGSLTKGSYYLSYELDQGATVVKNSLKNSKPSVAKFGFNRKNGILYMNIRPQKKGSTKVSFQYKYNGKVKKYQFTIRIVPYTKAFQTLKIGKTGYAARFKNSVMPYTVSGKLSGALKVTSAKNWEIANIWYVKGKNATACAVGETVKIPGGGYLRIDMYNTKYKYTETFKLCKK